MSKTKIVSGLLAAVLSTGLMLGTASTASAACDGEVFSFSHMVEGTSIAVYFGNAGGTYYGSFRGARFTRCW